MSKKPKKPATPQGVASAMAKMHESSLHFIEKMCSQWEKGDYFGAMLRAGGATEGVFVTVLVCFAIVHLIRGGLEGLLWVTLILLVVPPALIMRIAFCRARDDKSLARGHAVRMTALNPTSLYRIP